MLSTLHELSHSILTISLWCYYCSHFIDNWIKTSWFLSSGTEWHGANIQTINLTWTNNMTSAVKMRWEGHCVIMPSGLQGTASQGDSHRNLCLLLCSTRYKTKRSESKKHQERVVLISNPIFSLGEHRVETQLPDIKVSNGQLMTCKNYRGFSGFDLCCD
jgi:hypothetical protein